MHLRDCGDQGCRGTRSLKLLDQVICNKGFMKLLSLGKQRFSSLRSAVINGQPCPMDNRFFPQLPKAQTEKRAAIHDFLHGLYEQAAESLPDLHHSSSNKRPRRGQFRYDEKSMDKKNFGGCLQAKSWITSVFAAPRILTWLSQPNCFHLSGPHEIMRLQ